MIIGLQAIALLFALMMMYFTYLHFRRGETNFMEFGILALVWVGAILIILFPNFFDAISKTIAIARSFDLAVIGGFIFVIPIVYISYIRTKRLEKKIEDYVRAEALNDTGKKDVKKR